jgi:hypothetical protein
MAAAGERGLDLGLRERLVGGVSLYVERPVTMPGAGDAARIENLIDELEERDAGGAHAARAEYAQLRALLTESHPEAVHGRTRPGRLARFLRRDAGPAAAA